jgi:hypothetical protein
LRYNIINGDRRNWRRGIRNDFLIFCPFAPPSSVPSAAVSHLSALLNITDMTRSTFNYYRPNIIKEMDKKND